MMIDSEARRGGMPNGELGLSPVGGKKRAVGPAVAEQTDEAVVALDVGVADLGFEQVPNRPRTPRLNWSE